MQTDRVPAGAYTLAVHPWMRQCSSFMADSMPDPGRILQRRSGRFLTEPPSSGKSLFTMQGVHPGFALILAACLTAGCFPSYRPGLPPDSPFRQTATFAREGFLPQGSAVGDVSSDSALLWFRTDETMVTQVVWAPVEAWEKAKRMATAVLPFPRTPLLTTAADTDFIGKVLLKELAPATRYRYEVLAARKSPSDDAGDLQVAARGEFTTLARGTDHVPVSFSWSGDLGGQHRCREGAAGYPIFDVMQGQALDFFVFLGDTIYSDDVCPSPPNEPGADFKAVTLDDYRAKHRYQRGAAALRRLLAAVPVYVIWDDHEVRNNFAGPAEESMPLGRQAFLDYWPIRTPADDPHRLYRRVRAGADLELFILDTRQYRSLNAEKDGPAKTMLGERQLQWLLEGLTNSNATWKAIVSSVPLSIPKSGGLLAPGNDGWAGGSDGTGFERERQVIVDTILGWKLQNVVWLAADVHLVQGSAYDPNRDGIPDFHEFVAGPLSAATGRLPEQSRELNPDTLIHEAGYVNFGLVHVTQSSFQVNVIDGNGKVRFSHRILAR